MEREQIGREGGEGEVNCDAQLESGRRLAKASRAYFQNLLSQFGTK